MSGTLQASVVKDSASATNNLALDSSGNVTVGNNLTVSGTGVLNIGSGQVYKDASGNVGIGTSSPVTKLNVNGGVISAVDTRSIGDYQFLAEGGYNGYSAAISFQSRTSSGGTLVEMARISADGESSWNTTTTTQDAYLRFLTAQDGTSTERMRIDSSGNLLVGTTSASGNFTVKGLGSTSGSYATFITNSSSTGLLYLRNDGYLFLPSTYNNTLANAANMFINTDGSVYRSTSSLKYKVNVQNYGKGLADLAKLRPVTFNSKPVEGRDPDTHTYAGFIAEEVHDAGLTEFVQYNAEGQPDALAYANMAALLTKALQEAVAKIDALETRIAQLESKQ